MVTLLKPFPLHGDYVVAVATSFSLPFHPSLLFLSPSLFLFSLFLFALFFLVFSSCQSTFFFFPFLRLHPRTSRKLTSHTFISTKKKKKINSNQVTEETQTQRPSRPVEPPPPTPPQRQNEGNHRRQTAREGRHDTSITNSHNRNVQQRQTAAQRERLAAITAPAAGA